MLGPHIFPAKEDGSDPRTCPNCGVGRLSLRVGKFGAFIGCSNYPECRYTRQFSDGQNGQAEAAPPEGRLLGYDPETGLPVTLRTGRFGPYVQLGEGNDDEKPKRASVPRGIDAASLDLKRALELLSPPREVGVHPERGKPSTAGIGRYGPFVLHEGTYANLENVEEVFHVGINRAVALLAEKAAGGGKGRFQRAKPVVLHDLGPHPVEGGKIEVLSGRYGPYVSHNKVNATLPKDKDPATVTVDEAVALLAERIAKNGGKPPARTRKAKAAPGGKARAKSKTKADAEAET
jgi:DNA topoisomerase-1